MWGIKYVARFWYYFRIGYSTYLTFILGYVSTFVTVYYLAIKESPFLLTIFPKFLPFAVIGTLIGGPMSIIVGWLHLKRTPVYNAEADITVESNPYTYKASPGVWKDAVIPLLLELLVQLRKLSDAEGTLSIDEKKRIKEIEDKMQVLANGGYVGTPRKRF